MLHNIEQIRTAVLWTVVAGGVIVALATSVHALDKEKICRQLERHEGKRAKVYKDSLGIPTVGIGFNLQRGDAKSKIEGLGLDYQKVLAGEQPLTDAQIHVLLVADVETAVADCEKLFANFGSLDDVRQRVLADMMFNLGTTRLGKFKKLKAAVEAGDYAKAGDEMMDSTWYDQVKSRGTTLVDMMRTGVDPAWLK